ncbi:MAG: SOS response-associated peptidase [Sporolactobacillus sp.]|nr:SOS response-associated peptidase [Sporolactobacillus sp.]
MCGRYTMMMPFTKIIRRFQAQKHPDAADYVPSYNVSPGRPILCVINDGKINRMGFLHWGLIPPWARDEKIGYRLINARKESLMEKPSFRHAFLNRRCLIVADGFYEWKHTGDGKKTKQPLRFCLKSGEPFALAGLWEAWISPKDGKKRYTCTIITTDANELMAPVHDRMPVILNREDEAKWLNPANHDANALLTLLKPYPSAQMTAYAVSPAVNSVKNDSPSLIKPL